MRLFDVVLIVYYSTRLKQSNLAATYKNIFQKKLSVNQIKLVNGHFSLPQWWLPGRVSTVVSKMSSKNITCTAANAATAGIATQC